MTVRPLVRCRLLIRVRFPALLALGVLSLCGQTDTGELRLTVSDSAGLPVGAASAELSSEVNQYRQTFQTDAAGRVVAKRLPYGLYHLQVQRRGLTSYSGLVEIRSAIPRELQVVLPVAAVETQVTVTGETTLIDPHRTGTIHRIGGETLDRRPTSSPGRSLSDLVNTQPGWLLEANGIFIPGDRSTRRNTWWMASRSPISAGPDSCPISTQAMFSP